MPTEVVATKTTAGSFLVSAFLPFIFATLLLFVVLAVVLWLTKHTGKARAKGDFFLSWLLNLSTGFQTFT